MKKLLVLISVSFLAATQAHAFLPITAFTSLPLTIYGIYTTADPTCTSGFVATSPLSANAAQIDLTKNPSFGSGSIANPIACTLIVMRNGGGPYTWSAGNYTSTTSGFSDSVCNAGGTTGTVSTICNGGSVASWPSNILAAVTAAGLTPANGSCNGAGTNTVVPLYVSVYSACTGNPNKDSGSCISGGNDTTNSFQPPTAANDTLHGLNMASPGISGAYRFFIDPRYSFGATSATACGGNQPAIFGFEAIN